MGELNPADPQTRFRLPDGRIVSIATALLIDTADVRDVDTAGDEITVIPLIEETLSIGRRTVATGTVRLRKMVEEYTEALNEPLAIRSFDVERVVLNRVVETAPEVRHEGRTTVYSVVEEQMVLTKQLVLKEEVHVTRRDSERMDTQVVTLRRERLDVEREPGQRS